MNTTLSLDPWEAHRTLAQSSLFRGLSWRAVGPVKIGARVEAIAIPPGNTGTIYVGVGAGNLWKTVNNGLTWRPIFEHEGAFAIGDVAVSQSHPETVWVGTGEAQPRYAGYAYPGRGVFKSVDGGESWRHLGLTETQHIAKVLLHPTNPKIAYVAALGKQWTPNPERGVYQTRDGGAQWEKVLFIDSVTGVVDLAMDPRNPNLIYAWAWQIEEGRRGGLFVSRDGGNTWQRRTRGLPTGALGRASVEVAPSNPKIVYLFLDNRAPSTHKNRPFTGGEVYRSENCGESWRKVNTEDLYDVFGTFGWKFTDIRVDPRNANHLYILGNHAFQSWDGGATWKRLGDRILRVHETPGRALHLDHHELVIDPANPNRLLLGNDGGLFLSYDAGESWLHLNNIPVAQMYFVATDESTPYRIYAGTQDNAALIGASEAQLDDAIPDPWHSVYLDRWTGGDSFVTLPDPTDPRLVYYEHQNGALMRMDTTGKSILSGGPSTEFLQPNLPGLRFSWYTPFLISSHNPRTLYLGGNRVLKTTDRGTTWQAISPDLSDPPMGDRSRTPTGAFTMLAESVLVPGLLVGGTEGGRLWLTQDDGASWSRIDTGLPKKWVSRVTLSRREADTLYVSFTGFREDDTRPYVYLSTDRGKTWRPIVANLPPEAVNVIKEDPSDPNLLYVGTDLGVYVSRDRGQSWESLCATLPSTPVQDLTVQSHESELVIGTYGRGAWILDLTPIRKPSTEPLFLYPIRAITLDPFPWDSVPGDRRGRPIARFCVSSATAGAAKVVVKKATGEVVRQWRVVLWRGANTLTWDLQTQSKTDVAPGNYRVEVHVGALTATGSLTVQRSRSDSG